MHDILIKNGKIIDGTGKPMYHADIAVNNGKITSIGDLGGDSARTVIDAKGKYITPGFIDMSNRSDVYWRLFKDPMMESLIRQGITTIMGGNSGTSLAPIYNEQMILSAQKWANVRDVNVDWQSMKEFLTIVEKHRIAPNFGTFVGHGTLRRGIVGDEVRALTTEELKILARHITKAIKEGAFGVSLGLIYTHARDASHEELQEIAKVVQKQKALYVVHLRDEDQELLEALEEILSVIEETPVATHITHLKAVGETYWNLMEDALLRLDTARAKGIMLTFDVYPYTYTGSVLYTFLPAWVSEGGKKMMLARLRNRSVYEEVIKELKHTSINFSHARVATAMNLDNLQGRTIGEIAHDRDISVEEMILELLIVSEGRVIVFLDALSEENVVRSLKSPYSLITSNSPGYTITDLLHERAVHPRSFGAFPRVFARYVRARKILSWELAVHKSTGKVADQLQLYKRGFLRNGFYADILIIDPEKITDHATIESPIMYAEGVEWVLINGRVTIANNTLTGVRPGAVLRYNKSV